MKQRIRPDKDKSCVKTEVLAKEDQSAAALERDSDTLQVSTTLLCDAVAARGALREADVAE